MWLAREDQINVLTLFAKVASKHEIQHLTYLPLTAAGRSAGVLVATSVGPLDLSIDDVDLLTQVGFLLGGAISQAQLVRELDEQSAAAVALIENIQREDLNPLEEATALRRLIDDFQMTQQEAADAVGRSRPAVSNLLRLLELMQEVKDLIDMRRIEMGHARALLSLDDTLQVQAAREVVRKQLSVRETENLVRRLQQSMKMKGQRRVDPDILRLQNRISEQLGARVRIQHLASGKGKLTIAYNNADEFEGILERLDLKD